MKGVNRRTIIGVVFLALVIGLGFIAQGLRTTVEAQGSKVQVPLFQVDPMWPKPLPNNWVLGNTIGVTLDSQDHVWIVHRGDTVEPGFAAAVQKDKVLGIPHGTCCVPAPPVLHYDPAGNLMGTLGGGPYGKPTEGYEWVAGQHGIRFDYKGNLWIASNDGKDSRVIKLTRDGKFLLQLGTKGLGDAGSNDLKNLGRPTNSWVDQATNEVYIPDGYGNRRVIVFDSETGAYKRHWGAYGNKPDDTPFTYNPDAPLPKQFGNPVHCVIISKDNFVYVCDRQIDRLQVFRKDGTFVKEQRIAPRTLRSGSVWDMAFSNDEKYIFVADGVNEKVHVLLRETLEELTSFGSGGRQPGQFFGVHNVALDSKGNLYTAETYTGARVQKFVYKGMGAVPKQDQGTVWPARTN